MPWLVVIILTLVTSCREKTSEVLTTEISRETVEVRVSIPGTLRGVRESRVHIAYTGYVREFLVKVGEHVEKGQGLVRISQTPTQALSEVFPIRAPFSGSVSQIPRREGEFVRANDDQPLMILHDFSEVWMSAAVSEGDIAKIEPGMSVEVRISALSKTYQGKLISISESPRLSQDRWDRGRVEYPVEILLQDHDEQLRSGMSAVAHVIAEQRENVLALPPEYIHRDSSGFFLVDVNGASHRIDVGLVSDRWVEIVSEIPEGFQARMVSFDH